MKTKMAKVFLPASVLLAFSVIDFTQGRRPDYNGGHGNKYDYPSGGGGGGGGSSMGTEDRPLEEGRRVTLDCGIPVGNGQLLSCIWKHKLPVSWDQQQYGEEHVSCGAAVQGKCVASSSQLGSYASRLRVSSSQSACQLEVTSADPRDSGDWDCHVIYEPQDSTGGQPPAELNTLQVFVANRSEIAITEPDLQSDRSATIEYNLYSGNDRIEATCTAYGGRPRPTFEWFVDDDRNEVTDKVAQLDEVDVSRDGTVVEGTITFSPTLDDLCNQFHLDQACRISREEEDFQKINFNLICKVRQGAFYVSENEQQQAKVIVEVNSSTSLLASCWSLALVFFAIKSRQ